MYRKKILWIIIALSVLILSLPFLLTRNAIWESFAFDNTGQIGDTIGGITAPFVGLLSIALLAITLWKQLQFNKLQAKLAIDEQFKSIFIQLTDQHRRLANEISFKGWYFLNGQEANRITQKAEGAFQMCCNNLKKLFDFFDKEKYEVAISDEEYKSILSNINKLEEIGISEENLSSEYSKAFNMQSNAILQRTYMISESVFRFYRNPEMTTHKQIAFIYHKFQYFNSDIGRYFRHLYYILTILEREERKQLELVDDLPEECKKIEKTFRTYANILPAQMSRSELTMLFYNCFLYPKMMHLVNRYDLLQTLPAQALMLKAHQDAASENSINLAAKTERLKSVLGKSLTERLNYLTSK